MKRALALAAALVLLLPAIAAAQPAEAEKEAAIKTALDYSDGGYSGDAARMERALHTDLNKLYFFRRSPAMGLAAGYSCVSELVELTRSGLLILEPDKRMTDVAVLEITEDVACVRVRTARWCDYLQMIKSEGQWKIINVLWTPGRPGRGPGLCRRPPGGRCDPHGESPPPRDQPDHLQAGGQERQGRHRPDALQRHPGAGQG